MIEVPTIPEIEVIIIEDIRYVLAYQVCVIFPKYYRFNLN